MSDKTPKFPEGTNLRYPDGSVYVYCQASEDLGPGTFVDPDMHGKLTKFKGAISFPSGIVTETVPKDYYTFVMVTAPQKKAPSPIITPKH